MECDSDARFLSSAFAPLERGNTLTEALSADTVEVKAIRLNIKVPVDQLQLFPSGASIKQMTETLVKAMNLQQHLSVSAVTATPANSKGDFTMINYDYLLKAEWKNWTRWSKLYQTGCKTAEKCSLPILKSI